MLSRDYAVKDICSLMEVSRAGYYKWKNREPSPRDNKREEIVALVKKVHGEHPTHGYRWTAAYLHINLGVAISENYASIAYNELIKDTNIVRSMSRAGKPTDNPVNEALNGWIKEELYVEFKIEQCWRSPDAFRQTIERYVKYYNTQRPCFAIGYDTPENYRKRYYKGELPRKQTFESRVLSTEPKFVQKRRQNANKQGDESFVSTFGKENTTKNEIMSTFVNRFGPKTTPVSTLENINQ